MKQTLLWAMLLLGAAGCRGTGIQQGSIPTCDWPAAADTFDAQTNTGCLPKSLFQVCSVPSGSTINADGTITTPDGGTVSCDSACSPSEYSLTCRSAGTGQPIPQPDSTLGCTVIPVPGPSNTLFYCCPCST